MLKVVLPLLLIASLASAQDSSKNVKKNPGEPRIAKDDAQPISPEQRIAQLEAENAKLRAIIAQIREMLDGKEMPRKIAGDLKVKPEGDVKGKPDADYKNKSDGGYEPKPEGKFKDKSDGNFQGKQGDNFKAKPEGELKGKPESERRENPVLKPGMTEEQLDALNVESKSVRSDTAEAKVIECRIATPAKDGGVTNNYYILYFVKGKLAKFQDLGSSPPPAPAEKHDKSDQDDTPKR